MAVFRSERQFISSLLLVQSMTLSQRKPLSIHWLSGTIPEVKEFKKVKIKASRYIIVIWVVEFECSEQKNI